MPVRVGMKSFWKLSQSTSRVKVQFLLKVTGIIIIYLFFLGGWGGWKEVGSQYAYFFFWIAGEQMIISHVNQP